LDTQESDLFRAVASILSHPLQRTMLYLFLNAAFSNPKSDCPEEVFQFVIATINAGRAVLGPEFYQHLIELTDKIILRLREVAMYL
jgi:hypothetical protein